MPIYSKNGNLPKGLSKKELKNTIVTPKGVERVVTYTDSDGTARRKSILYVGLRGGLTAAGKARPSSVQFEKSVAPRNAPVKVHVSFNQAVTTTGAPTIAVRNVAANTSVVATANTSVSYAGNTLSFVFTPTVAGTYTIAPQTIASSSVSYTNVAGSPASANNVIAADVIHGNLTVTS